MPKNASGLPWYLGCFAHNLDRLAKHEQKIGRKVTCLQVSPERGSWASIMDPWWLRKPAGFTGIFDVAVPLWQKDGDLATAAKGGYDSQWEKLGKMIHDAAPGSCVRPGWEFNLTGGWPWTANRGNVAQWRQAFQYAAKALKRGGPSLVIEWCPNAGGAGDLAKTEDAYPGDAYVDAIGLDSYDWDPPCDSDENWKIHRDGYGEWSFWINFARDHGKWFTVPEFGGANGNQNCGHDNPKFMSYVMPLLAQSASHIYMISYFDEDAAYIQNSIGAGQLPNLGAEYKRQLDAIAAAPVQPAPAPVTPSPTAPVAVTAKEMAAGEVTIAWTPASTATVARDGQDTSGDGPWSATGQSSPFTFTKLQPGTTYTFSVTTGNGVTGRATVTTAAAFTPVSPTPVSPTPITPPDTNVPTPAPADDMVNVIVPIPRSWLSDKAPIYKDPPVTS